MPMHLWRLVPLGALVGLASCGGGSGDSGSAPPPIDRQQIVAGAGCTGANQTGWCVLPALDTRAVAASACWQGSRCVAVGARGYVALTSDAGATWTRVADLPVGTHTLGQVVMADASTVYAATTYGEAFWRSADGGRTWGLASEPDLDLAPTLPPFAAPSLTALDAQTLLVWRSGARPYLSSDGGASWRQLDRAVASVAADGTLFGSSHESLSVDLGQTWQPLSIGGLGHSVLSRSSQGRSRLRLLVRDGAGLKVWRSDDGGQNASLVDAQLPPSSSANDVWQAVMRADGSGHVLAASNVTFASTTVRVADAAQLWVTADDGVTWTVAKELLPGGANQVVDVITSGFVGDDALELASVDRQQPLQRVILSSRVIDLRTGADLPLPVLPSPRTSRLKARLGNAFLAADSAGVWWQSSADAARWTALPGSGAGTPWNAAGVASLLPLDAQRLLAVGQLSGELWRSDDFGRTWSGVTASQGVRGSSLRRLGDGSVLLASTVAAPWLSTDDGSTWRALPQPPGASSGSVLFLDRRFGWARRESCADTVTCTYELLVSDDAGSTWTTAQSVTAAPRTVIEWVQFVDRQRAVKLGASADFAYSADGGRTWAAAPVTDAEGRALEVSQTQRLRFDAAGTGWALATIAGQTGVLRSTDGGRSWLRLALPADLPPGAALTDVVSPDGRTVWVGTSAGRVLASRDGGSTWRLQDSGTRLPILTVNALDAQTAWLGLADGRILASITGGD